MKIIRKTISALLLAGVGITSIQAQNNSSQAWTCLLYTSNTSDFINTTISNNQWKQTFTHFISVFFYCRVTRCFD